MSDFDSENYIREESFGLIDCGFYDFKVEAEFEDVSIIGSPEKLVLSNPTDPDLGDALRHVLRGSREVIRDLSRYLEMAFSDVYAMNVRDEGWEEWAWDHTKVPKVGDGRLSVRNFPVLKVENSIWKDKVVPEWNRDWMDQVSHWRLISLTNNIDILARSAKGEWRTGD